MALVKKVAVQATSVSEGKLSAVTTREAEAQRKKARTLAKQQQAAERIAAAGRGSVRGEHLRRRPPRAPKPAERASKRAPRS